MQTRTLEIRPDFEHDPAGGKLERLLAAQAAHDHALARRTFLAHLLALLGVPLWFLAAGVDTQLLRALGLILFPVFLLGFLASVIAESSWRRRLGQAERDVAVRHLLGRGGVKS